MTIGDPSYQLALSRIAYGYQGAVSIEYLDNASAHRVRDLNKHLSIIAEDLRRGK